MVTGCSAADEEPEVDDTETSQVEEEVETTEEAPAPAGDQAEVTIGETIDDPDFGDSVEVLSAVRDFPSEEEADVIAEGGEVVLVQVTVTPGQEGYGGLISMGNFKISWDDGAEFWGNKTRMVAEEMEAAGFEPLDDVSRSDGGSHTGWMAFLADERADAYTIQYERSGAEVIGSDEVIDRFQTTFEVPAA